MFFLGSEIFMKLDQRVAIVTGSGSGIGRAIVQRFAREGASVVVADIDATAATKVAEEIDSAAISRATDITSADDVRKLVEDTTKTFGRLDILVNNAGRTFQAPVMDMPIEEWDNVINVNLRGAFLCCKFASPHLVKSPNGRIINIVSLQMGVPFAAAYCASKMGLMALTQSLMHELAPNVTANAVCPGFTQTPLAMKAITLKAELAGITDDEIYEQLQNAIPLRRYGEGEDVANVVAFLASDEAAYVTGALYHASGGLFGHAVGAPKRTEATPS